MARRKDGNETWNRLLNWTKGQAPSERLAGHVLALDGFASIDPSHPLGGRDGTKDILATRGGLRWVAGAYFPRGQQPLKDIKKKFKDDFAGVGKNKASAFAFVTNQEITVAQRRALEKLSKDVTCEIYHLERVARLLDSPNAYGLRLEYLDIEMSKEEQLAFFAWMHGESKNAFAHAIAEQNRYLWNLLTGGDSYCRLDAFDGQPIEIIITPYGDFPLLNLRVVIVDKDLSNEVLDYTMQLTSELGLIQKAVKRARLATHEFKRLPTDEFRFTDVTIPYISCGESRSLGFRWEANNGSAGGQLHLRRMENGVLVTASAFTLPDGTSHEDPLGFPRLENGKPDWSCSFDWNHAIRRQG